ncbi:MAG: class I SAM-dependent methyltransferase [Patescibacteria group bacterium]|nr:class I SAM-dependent methyltransferase [Patescibacteria group bacterium]
MTIWDKIYKNYQKGGPAWATIEGRILPQFINFLKFNKFNIKHALEIGCGMGKYLVILKELGFKTDGIDSSITAMQMTKNNLKDDSNIILADMFEYEIPKNKYDLIFSIFSVHHGLKNQVKSVIDEIYSSLMSNGKFFITLPDYNSSKSWDTFKNNKDLGNGVFTPLSGPEKGLPHSFYNRKEVYALFNKFTDIKVELEKSGKIVHGNWIISGKKL